MRSPPVPDVRRLAHRVVGVFHRGERGWGRVWLVSAVVVVVAVLFVGVFPTRTFLNQRAAVARAEEQLRVLDAENERLDERVDALKTSEEVERLAREQFELVMPGERPYVVEPPADPPARLPTGWPFGGLVVSGSPGN
jgi:cell division protein FtsB